MADALGQEIVDQVLTGENLFIHTPRGYGTTKLVCSALKHILKQQTPKALTVPIKTVVAHATEQLTVEVGKIGANFIEAVCRDGIPKREELRARWVATRQSWDELGSGEAVDYEGSVQLSYAAGTTPLHAIALHELIHTEVNPNPNA